MDRRRENRNRGAYDRRNKIGNRGGSDGETSNQRTESQRNNCANPNSLGKVIFMPSPQIEEFAKILVREVRDAAIHSTDLCLRPDVTHIIAKRWRDAAHAGQLEPIASVLIPDIVDDTIFQLLRAIDQGVLQLSFTDSNGQTINLSTESPDELGGWYMGEWREKYTKERAPDNFPDLK